MNSALDPLVSGIKIDLENHIRRMHSEDFTRYIFFAREDVAFD